MIKFFKRLYDKYLIYKNKRDKEKEIKQKKYDNFIKLKKLQERKRDIERWRDDGGA